VRVLDKYFSIGGEVNHLEKLKEVEVKVRQLLPDQKWAVLLEELGHLLNLLEGFLAKSPFIVNQKAAHRRYFFEIPDSSLEHVNFSFFFDCPSQQLWHPSVGNVLMNCKVLSQFHVPVDEVWQVWEV